MQTGAITQYIDVAQIALYAFWIFFAGLIERLGIAAEINARATIVEAGTTADGLVDGRGDLAVQQVSEIAFYLGLLAVLPA